MKQSIDFFRLPLRGCDLMLGVQWLKTLGLITWDFNTLSMKFRLEGRKVTLKGLHGGAIRFVSKKQMAKLTKVGGK